MATVQTLKDKNDSTFYPVTKTEAVYNADGSETLDNTLNTKATISTSAGDANKMMKADGTKALVGSDNIDFTTQEVDLDYNTTYWEPVSGNVTPKLYIYGKFAWLIGTLNAKSTLGSTTTIMTIPSGYLNSHLYFYFPVVTSANTCVRANISGNTGVVNLRIDTSATPITTGTAIWLNTWWFIS